MTTPLRDVARRLRTSAYRNWLDRAGRKALARGELAEARTAFARAVSMGTPTASLLKRLGIVEAKLGLHGSAVQHLEAARASGDLDGGALSALGEAHRQLRNWPAAVEAIESALIAGAESPENHYRLGRSHEQQGAYEAAARAFARALQLDPSPPQWHFRLGSAYEAADNLAAAEVAYIGAIERREWKASWHYRLARVRQRRGDWSGAAAAYQAAIDRDGTEAAWHRRLGIAHDEAGDRQRAAHSLEAAVLRDSTHAVWFYDLGRAKASMGDFTAAVRSYERAVALEDRHPTWHHALGFAHLKLRNWPEAAKALERAVAGRPEDARWRQRLTTARDRIDLYGPPSYQRPTYLEGVLTALRGELPHRRMFAVGVGSGHVPGSEDDPLIDMLLRLGADERERITTVLIEPQPHRARDLQEMLAGVPNVTILPYAIGGDAGTLTLYQVKGDARTMVLASGSAKDPLRYTSTDRELVVRRAAEEYGWTDDEAATRVEPFSAEVRDLNELLTSAGFPREFDLLQVDVQGMDAQVVLSLDPGRFRPRVISYEVAHLEPGERDAVHRRLREQGYEVRRVSTLDNVAVWVGQ